MTKTPANIDDSRRPIGRRLALGFGSVSAVAVFMSVVLLGIIYNVSGLIHGMRHDESSIRQGFELATAVREQSLHIAHTLIEADDSHLEHYEEWRLRLRTRIQELAQDVPVAERWRLEELGKTTQQIHDLFVLSAMPAAKRGDAEEARRVHRQLEALGRRAAEHADILARSIESQMAHAHDLATNSTRLGLLAGGLGALVVIALSAFFAFSLRRAVIKPLVVLTDAARRLGRGEFDLRVGEVGEGELATLGRAFDRMSGELALRQERLVQNERMTVIGQLAAGVAHELNNPIGIIRGYLKTMTPEDDAETLREELAILDEEAAQCQRIAEDLLSYSRADDLDVDAFSVHDFLKESAERYQSSNTESRRVQVDVEEALIEADRTRLRQVVLNLLLNAGQASPKEAKVALKGLLDGEFYKIEVSDEGPGVAPAERARVFEPFYSKRAGGSGLGLSVVDGIVRAHGGRIEISASAEGGALFTVFIPVKQQKSRSERPERKA